MEEAATMVRDYILIDSGVTGVGECGRQGLFRINQASSQFSRGDFVEVTVRGPSAVPGSTEVLSITMQNLPFVVRST
jgi:hypothetical protein